MTKRPRVATIPRTPAPTPPREVRLNGSGAVALAVACVLALGGALGGAWLYVESEPAVDGRRPFEATAEATVTRVERRRGEQRPTVLHYAFPGVDGLMHKGRVRLRKDDPRAGTAVAGMSLPVRYDALEPSDNWVQGYAPRAIPFWAVVLLPAAAIASALGLAMLIRREWVLLEYGRSALGTVVSVEKLRGREHKAQRVLVEWNKLSGAKVRHTFEAGGSQFSAGMTVPVVYDVENPRRFAKYPMTLVRIRS